MNPKEQLFCRLMAAGAGEREAAAGAGFRHPRKKGVQLLAREDIRREIESCRKQRETLQDAAAGLRRIAFGSVADGIALALRETPPTPEELEKMDLFAVSEIKRPKGGGLEIKFFDRIKALEQLQNHPAEDGEGMLPFYYALQEGARRLKEDDR